jgi:hypothetical protein
MHTENVPAANETCQLQSPHMSSPGQQIFMTGTKASNFSTKKCSYLFISNVATYVIFFLCTKC